MVDKIRSQKIIWIIAGFILGWAASALVFNLNRDKTVAVVDGTPIKQSEVYLAMKDQIGNKTMERLINNQIVMKTAQKYGISISDQELEREFNKKIELEYHSKEAFQESLATMNITLAEAKEELRLGMLFDRIATRDIPVSDAELQQYFEKHPEEFLRPEMRKVREIVLKTRTEAEAARRDLVAGADFEKMVREKSVGLDRDKGGDRGVIIKGLLNPIQPIVEKSVFALKLNEISQVVECPDGFHIIRVEQIIPAYQASLAEMKQAITLRVKIQKSRPFQEVLNGLRSESSIQLLENFDRGK